MSTCIGELTAREVLPFFEMIDHPTTVLYHAGCADGFGAAWALYLTLGDAAQYVPVSYGKPLPDVGDGGDVFIVDFSYGLEELRRLRQRMRVVTVIDHHSTMAQVIKQFAAENTSGKVIFTTRRSGAALTWEEFLPAREMPELIRYIEDRDLWTWALPESREVSAALASYPRDFAVWDELAWDVPRLKAEGPGAAPNRRGGAPPSTRRQAPGFRRLPRARGECDRLLRRPIT